MDWISEIPLDVVYCAWECCLRIGFIGFHWMFPVTSIDYLCLVLRQYRCCLVFLHDIHMSGQLSCWCMFP